MGERLDDIVLTIEHPDYREPDAKPGRERLFKRVDSNLWMRVVLEFNREFERMVTAFLQSKDPRPRHSR